MKFGLKDSENLFLQDNLIKPLKKKGLKIYIFGSRATGKQHPFSDVDILISGQFDHESDLLIMKTKEFFEESVFPYKIDLVKESDLAQSYRNNVFRSRIEI